VHDDAGLAEGDLVLADEFRDKRLFDAVIVLGLVDALALHGNGGAEHHSS